MNRIHSALLTLWRNCVSILSHSPSIKVWQKYDRQGRPYCWYIYDPYRQRTICMGSETEVRIWLDKQYLR
jgi:hypothetical protein